MITNINLHVCILEYTKFRCSSFRNARNNQSMKSGIMLMKTAHKISLKTNLIVNVIIEDEYHSIK